MMGYIPCKKRKGSKCSFLLYTMCEEKVSTKPAATLTLERGLSLGVDSAGVQAVELPAY